MARSLGLAAYRALVRRSPPSRFDPTADRPRGELIWLHAPEPGSIIAMLDLAARLCAARMGAQVLISQPATLPLREMSVPDGVHICHLPNDHPDAVAAFLDHWRPDVCLWAWGGLRPNLVLDARARGIEMVLFDVDPKGFTGKRDTWLPDLTRKVLQEFHTILTRSPKASRMLQRLGLTASAYETMTPVLAGGQVLPCADSDLTDLSQALGGRPAWFANQLSTAEVSIVLDAHRFATRYSHRLLLMVHTANPETAQALRTKAEAASLSLLDWGDGRLPDAGTQVVLTEDAGDMGLFYRVAPLSFLGASLCDDPAECDPLQAAALGSAVLYGPKVRQHLPSYTRLAAVGAARIVNDANALGNAVSRLIAPDQAASMAHAGWNVISEGAALMDQLVDLTQDILDERIST